jgi:hypothetical protein
VYRPIACCLIYDESRQRVFSYGEGTVEKICQQSNECKELNIAAGQKKGRFYITCLAITSLFPRARVGRPAPWNVYPVRSLLNLFLWGEAYSFGVAD